jgi:flagellar biosynthesis/type III secretory pathway protein FliH
VCTGLAALYEVSACVNCQHPIHSSDGKRGWIHTLTGTFRCPEYPHGWAEPGAGEEEIQRRVDEAAAEAEIVGRDRGYEEGYGEGKSDGEKAGYSAGYDEGLTEGREQMHDQLLAVVNTVLDSAIATDQLRAELVHAMMRVLP